jgi:dienelactone hydrolase
MEGPDAHPGRATRVVRVNGFGAGACACVLLPVLIAAGCAEGVEVDPGETTPVTVPVAEFDPGQRIIPLPNALLMNPATGRLNVPPSCGELPGSGAERLRLAINQLDGFGTSEQSLVATFSEAVDPASLEGHVFLFRIAERGRPVLPPEAPLPVDVLTTSTQRAAADCASSSSVPSVVIRPRAPLPGGSTYLVVMAAGITTESGRDVQPSATWALVRQSEPPVVFPEGSSESALPTRNETPFDPAEPEDLETLHGLDLLWRGHAELLGAVDLLAPAAFGGVIEDRDDILLAWAFGTQTTVDLLQAEVPDSPANWIETNAAPLVVAAPAAGGGSPVSVEQAYAVALPGVACAAVGCDAIGTIYAASQLSAAPSVTSSSYLAGDDCSQVGAPAVAFGDPVAPTRTCDRQLPVLAVVPLSAPPTSGYPTVVFAHGLGRSKEDLLAVAGALARAGFASVAVDALDHGVRAVQISTDAAAGCDRAGSDRPCTESFGPTCAPQCFAPLLSADLAVTRDHLRQTALDHLALSAALGACSEPGVCGNLLVDPDRIGYLGQSLGALIGGVSAAWNVHVSAAVLNVGGAGWMQILSDTLTPAIRCPLVDALIQSGVLVGEPWNLGSNPDALCLSEAWKTDPGYLAFASAARWILDPVDPVNHASAFAGGGGPPVFVGEVVGDSVIPNSATALLTSALGLSPTTAGVASSQTPTATPAVLGAGNVWLRYQNLDGDAATQFPGNAYAHGSLLAPAAPSASQAEASGLLGTLQMQVDAVSYLVAHLGGAP